MLAAAALPLITSGAQAIFGAYQAIKGKNELDNANRPTYKIPDEIMKNLTIAERRALEGLPDAQKKAYVDNLNQGLASAMRGLSSRKAGIAGVSRLNQNQNKAYQDLLAMDAAAQQQNEQNAMNVRSEVAGYRDKAFDYNQVQPYDQQVAEGQALYGAGLQNIFGGLNTAGGIGQMAMGGQKSAQDPYAGIDAEGLYSGINNIYNRTKSPYFTGVPTK